MDRAVARHRHARVEELALVYLILVGNASRNRLRALETCRRLEEGALLTTMESGAAFRAIAFEVDVRRQSDRAVVTARGRYGLHQSRKARAGRILHGSRSCWPRRLLAVFPLVVGRAVRVLIAVLPVFAIRIHSYGCISLMVTALDSLTVAINLLYSEEEGQTKGRARNVRRLLQPPFYKRIARSGERVIVVVGTDA